MSYLARLRELDAEDADQASPGPLAELVEALGALRALPSCPAGASEDAWHAALCLANGRITQWGVPALALGWTAPELVSVDPQSWMRLDRRGVFLLWPEGRIVGVTAAEIAIKVGAVLMRGRRRMAP